MIKTGKGFFPHPGARPLHDGSPREDYVGRRQVMSTPIGYGFPLLAAVVLE